MRFLFCERVFLGRSSVISFSSTSAPPAGAGEVVGAQYHECFWFVVPPDFDAVRPELLCWLAAAARGFADGLGTGRAERACWLRGRLRGDDEDVAVLGIETVAGALDVPVVRFR